jgi:hypothetical protein
MKHDHIRLSIFLTAALLVGACKKELNVYPTTSEADGNLITNQLTAQQVLNGVYYAFAAGTTDGDNGLATEWSGPNEAYPSQLSGLVQTYYPSSLSTFSFVADDDNVAYMWQYCYALVNAANGFIGNITPVTTVAAPVKQQMIAEARFLRAFGNAELLLYFGQYADTSSQYGIILRDQPVSASNLNLPRSGVAAAYTSILADLDAAVEGLPVLNSAIYYANASAAKLLKARVLMNRGAAGDYAEVISLTGDLLANSPFSLEDSLKDIFLTNGFNSKEVILGIQPFPNETDKFVYYQEATYIAAGSLSTLLSDDGRNQWVYKAYTYSWGGGYPELTKYYSGDPVNIVQTPLSTYCYAFRLSEAYLLEAEAITISGGDPTSAKALLKTVMSHAGAGPTEVTAVDSAATPAALQLEIVKENMRNFAYENGADWFALRRLPFATIQSLNPNITTAAKLIFPIPTSELTYNKVIQNPGY